MSKTKLSHHHQRIKHLKIESSHYNVPDMNVNHSNGDSMSSTESDQCHSHSPSKIRHKKKAIQTSRHKNQPPLVENSDNIRRKISIYE